MSNTHATRFHAGSNSPGYLPDSEPACFPSFEEAKRYMIEELLLDADNVASWGEPHDCDDVPCPTYGDDCPEGKASTLTFAAEDLNLDNGPAWGQILNGRAYWIGPHDDCDCDEEDPEPEDVDPVRVGSGPGAMLARPLSTRPVWGSNGRSLSDLTPEDLDAYRDGQRIAHNTYAERDRDGSVGVRFHGTRILTFHLDGSFEVNSGGYRTVTTKQRLNALLPAGYRVFQHAYAWSISTPEGTFPFEDGDTWKIGR